MESKLRGALERLGERRANHISEEKKEMKTNEPSPRYVQHFIPNTQQPRGGLMEKTGTAIIEPKH